MKYKYVEPAAYMNKNMQKAFNEAKKAQKKTEKAEKADKGKKSTGKKK